MNLSAGYYTKVTDAEKAVEEQRDILKSKINISISELPNCKRCDGKGHWLYYFPQSIPCVIEDGCQGWQFAGNKLCDICAGTGKYISLKDSGEYF